MKRTLGITRLGAAFLAVTLAVLAALPAAAQGTGRTRSPIVFNGQSADGINQLLIMDGDGSNRRLVVADKFAHYGALSPNGAFVAYVSNTPTPVVGQTGVTGGTSLYVAALGGGTPRQVFADVAMDAPDWSPDGTRILFAVDKPNVYVNAANLLPHRDEIWSVGTDGSNAHFVGYGRGPRWAPGGETILFTDDGGLGVFVMDANGQNVRPLVSPAEFPLVTTPSWSPDGRIVAVRGGAQLEVMNGDGSARQVVYTDPVQVYDPTWSPDGRSIAFARALDGGTSIWSVGPDGSGLVRLSTADGDHSPRYRSFSK